MKSDYQGLLQNIASIALERKVVVGTAESCTGGLVSKLCTDYPGSSKWYGCGCITYSDESKQQILDVSLQTLEQHGAVSEQTVLAMGRGMLKISNVDVVVAITGIAGPSGATEANPIGTVWFAWGDMPNGFQTKLVNFSGDREEVRHQSAIVALEGLFEYLRK
jgi:nicotinamide-nucleotide amidase